MFKFTVPELKTNLSKKFKVYNKVKPEIEVTISKFNNVSDEALIKSGTVKLVNVVFLKRTLKEIFEEVDNAANKLKFVVRKAKMNFEYELTTIKVNVNPNFKDEFLKLNNKLNILCRMQ